MGLYWDFVKNLQRCVQGPITLSPKPQTAAQSPKVWRLVLGEPSAQLVECESFALSTVQVIPWDIYGSGFRV